MKYKVDVGDLPLDKAKAYIEKIKKEFEALVSAPNKKDKQTEITEGVYCKKEDIK